MASPTPSSSRRLPPWPEIWQVFSIGLFLACSWALYRVFWYIPSWLEYLSLWSILLVIVYVLSFALLDGALLSLPAVILALILPRRFFRQRFVAQGSLVTLTLGSGAYLVQRQVSVLNRLELWQLVLFPLLALVGLVLVAFIGWALFRRFPRLQSIAEGFASRMTIFGVIYTALGLVSWLVVIVRNIL
jgi:hypothetical protein